MTTHVPDTSGGPVEFNTHTDDGMYFSCNFNRKSANAKDTRPLHEIGGDFQSTPREALGMYIKDKLIDAGALSYGEQITDDTFAYYGKSHIDVRMINSTTLHLTF